MRRPTVRKARSPRRSGQEELLTARPSHLLVGVLNVPEHHRVDGPFGLIGRRVAIAAAVMFGAGVLVYLGRNGYRDARGGPPTFLDSIYFAAVSLSTTGYGDVYPYSETARLVNTVVFMPLRVAFLAVLVGTTIERLSERSRQGWKIQRWREKVKDHTVVIGYGTKGKMAVAALSGDGDVPGNVVVVDNDQIALRNAAAAGLVTVLGDATKTDVLLLAEAQRASSIIVATGRDDTSVLVTLTAREIAPQAKIVASIREAENKHLLQQSGGDAVVVSSETAGRLLGLATTVPSVVEVIADLLSPDTGLGIAERDVEPAEVGRSINDVHDIVLGVVRDGQLLRIGAPETEAIEARDRLLYVRNAGR